MSKITVSTEPSTRRTLRNRPCRGGGPARCPVRQTLSAATPAWLAGTPGPYRSTSDADCGGPPGEGGGDPPDGGRGGDPPDGGHGGDPPDAGCGRTVSGAGWYGGMRVGGCEGWTGLGW